MVKVRPAGGGFFKLAKCSEKPRVPSSVVINARPMRKEQSCHFFPVHNPPDSGKAKIGTASLLPEGSNLVLLSSLFSLCYRPTPPLPPTVSPRGGVRLRTAGSGVAQAFQTTYRTSSTRHDTLPIHQIVSQFLSAIDESEFVPTLIDAEIARG